MNEISQNSFAEKPVDIGDSLVFATPEINLDKILFDSKMFIAKGGFSNIYYLPHEGLDLIFKDFLPLDSFPFTHEGIMKRFYRVIYKNFKRDKEEFSKPPFARLRAFAYTKGFFPKIKWYVADFIPGETIANRLSSNKSISRKEKREILMTYSSLLENTHVQDKLIVDNNWNSVILDKKEVKICDYDFISPLKSASGLFNIFWQHYASRENLLESPLSKTSDLEQFALMIDHLFTRDPFLSEVHRRQSVNRAINNSRSYPSSRTSQIPKNLGEIVHDLISYPRDESLTASDFVSAIKSDYN